ncbi:MAG TPA: succinate dehydrogenase cytochrome b subunit [Bryobacteraceae bacterium]|nr:succinate dehydrogenase cytochrome b subunit [Bryobacteraceae bacterium]
MSTMAVDSRLARGLRFYETTLGKKAIMAVTGLILFGFLIAHMIGNLQVFAGPEALNHYAVKLREMPALLWFARLVLLISVVLHIVASVQLWGLQREARPVRYARKKNADSSYASRTMMWSGPIIAAFVVYHLAHFTWVILPGRYEHLKPYENVVYGFRQPLISLLYIIAIAMLCTHLYHGLWSMFQTLGVAHPRYTPALKRFAAVFSIALAAGFIAVPVAVLAGVVG